MYGCDKLNVYLSFLLSSIMQHGYTPEQMSRSTIIPIPKNCRKSLNDSENYRGIALSSPIGKLFDCILMNAFTEELKSSDFQFGYKENSSTTKCTFVVNEIINYYNTNGSDVYVILLDATKAFDRVHYIKLFELLLQRNLCPTVCRYLALQYTNQMCCVKWSHVMSDTFGVANGVKQGGVLSPILFNVYMDYLLNKLKESGAGCYIGNVFNGALSYADDLILLSPTRQGMKLLLQICEKYSIDFDISFNASKSKMLYFGNNTKVNVFQLCGKDIEIVSHEKHLGNLIGKNSLEKQIQNNVNELYSNVNILMAQFSSTTIDTKYQLFKSFCMSVYSSQLWDFSSTMCEKFFVAWRKCVRRLLSISPRTHSNLLHLICLDTKVDVQLHL